MIRRTFGILLVGNGYGVQRSTWGWCTFCRKRHGTSLPSHEGLSAGGSPRAHVVFHHTYSSIINIRAALSRIVGEDSKVQWVSASWLQQLFFFFFFESQRRHFSRSSAGKDDLVCLRVGLSSIDSRGTLVALDHRHDRWPIVVVFTAMP